MATPLPFTAPAATRPTIAPPGRSRSDLMAYLLEQSTPDNMLANPPRTAGEGLARTAGMGLDALMAKKVATQGRADATARNLALAEAAFPGGGEGSIDPRVQTTAQLLDAGLDPSFLMSSIQKNLGVGEAEKPIIQEGFDPATGRKTYFRVFSDGRTEQLGGVENDTMSAEAQQQAIDRATAGRATTSVNIDQTAESSEAKKLGETVVDHFAKIAEDLPAADQLLQSSQRMSEILSTTDTGTEAAFVDFVRRNTGFELSADAGKAQALQAMIQYMTPRMRVPGSGATSDMEMQAFQAAIPGLLGTPEGNAIVSQTIGGLAQRRVDMATIAQDYLTKAISSEEAVKRMRALPDPFVQYRTWQEKTGNLPKGLTPDAEPALATPTAAASEPAAAATPAVSNDADYDALPSGTVFVGPDGVKRRKP